MPFFWDDLATRVALVADDSSSRREFGDSSHALAFKILAMELCRGEWTELIQLWLLHGHLIYQQPSSRKPLLQCWPHWYLVSHHNHIHPGSGFQDEVTHLFTHPPALGLLSQMAAEIGICTWGTFPSGSCALANGGHSLVVPSTHQKSSPATSHMTSPHGTPSGL